MSSTLFTSTKPEEPMRRDIPILNLDLIDTAPSNEISFHDPVLARFVKLDIPGFALSRRVVCGVDKQSGQIVAMKTVHMRCDKSLKHFRNEINILDKIHSQGNVEGVIQVPNVMFAHDIATVVTPYTDCGSLKKLLDRVDGNLAERAVQAFAAQLASALAELHARSVIHNDVNLDNVLVSSDGQCRLSGFRLARFIVDPLSPLTEVEGQPRYFAPEKARGEFGVAADVWSLGMVLFECCSRSRCVPEFVRDYSTDCTSLVFACLNQDQHTRAPAADLLNMPFILTRPIGPQNFAFPSLLTTEQVVTHAIPRLCVGYFGQAKLSRQQIENLSAAARCDEQTVAEALMAYNETILNKMS